MARYDTDRHLYLPVWRMLRYLLVMYSMTTPGEDGPAGRGPADR